MAEGSYSIAEIAAHPFALGATIGLINGALAYKRDQYIGQDTVLAILIPTLAAEAYLAYRNPPKERSVFDLAVSTAAGGFVGLLPFVRWNPARRAWIESGDAPEPRAATLDDLAAMAGCGCKYS